MRCYESFISWLKISKIENTKSNTNKHIIIIIIIIIIIVDYVLN